MAIDANTIQAAELGAFAGGLLNETFSVSLADVDILAVDLTGGRMYEIDVDGGNDSYLRIFDERGVEVMAVDDSFDFGEAPGAQPYANFMANYSGRHYLAFSPYYLTDYSPFSAAGRVPPENPLGPADSSLTVIDSGSEFFPDANSINVITAKSANDESDTLHSASERIRLEYTEPTSVGSAGDVEMGRFDLKKGDVLIIDVNGRNDVDTLDAVIRVFSSTGTQIGFDNGSGGAEDSELIFVAPTASDYYIAVSGEGNSAYNGFDGTGVLDGDAGFFTAIIHRNPTLTGTSAKQELNGTEEDDYIVLLAGADSSDGGLGHDIIAGGDGNDLLAGGDGNDALYGEFNGDSLDGGAGHDVLVGGTGGDSLLGGTGNDLMEGNQGTDTLNGGRGNDRLSGGDDGDELIGSAGNDRLFGDAGDDVLSGGVANDTASGGTGNDTVNGGGGLDVLAGDEGQDVLAGGSANDTLSGGSEDDALSGDSGNDRLEGGGGNDTLAGGTEDDTFVFAAINEGVDTITDFVLASGDVIDLSSIFTGQANAGNLAQFVQASTSGISDSFLAVDADGLTGGLSFMIIAQVNGVTAGQLFDASNFVL